MPSDVWTTAVRSSPDSQRARHYLGLLRATTAAPALTQAAAESARILVALLSGSQASSELLIAHPDWVPLCLDAEGLRHARREPGLRRELELSLQPRLDANDLPGAFAALRQFKQRATLQIAARDLARLGPQDEITRELSNLADLCLQTVLRLCADQFRQRFGIPHHQDAEGRWQPTAFAVLGLGKLGGQELNYSSDIDLMFVYAEEGAAQAKTPAPGAPPAKGLANHAYFQRLIEALVTELTRMTPEGALYRVDLRLRPEGDAGPLARSLASYENYYAQWGQCWERMMLIKTRGVAGDSALAAEFLEMVQPFRYARSLPHRLLQEVAAMKQRIETEVVRVGEIDRNVKLGRGGIREIEFVVQALQLLHAGRQPFLQGAQTLPALDKLVQYHLLNAEDAHDLAAAYVFLRDTEHRLQMENHRQTHTLPTDRAPRQRLAALMGLRDLKDFNTALRRHTRRVRELYEAVVHVDPPEEALPLPREFAGQEPAWIALLQRHAFRQPDRSLALLRQFVEGPGYVHVSPRTEELARRLIIQLLQSCPRQEPDGPPHWPPSPLSDPDRVLARLDSYVAAYGSRAMLYETWASNPSLFTLLIQLFDRSEFLAETAIRTPDLVEDLMLSGHLRRRKTAAQILEELQHGARDADQRLWLRRYHQTEFMRLGLRDILGLADFEQSLVELSGLADACLQYALEAVQRKHRLPKPPFAILGLGKLGGTELTYGSDLDITFVTAAAARNLPGLQRLAAEVMEMLSSPTELGVAFATDARLRPDGDKGLLVNTLKAYEDYYRRRAQLWEIQAVSRVRWIAGDSKVGHQFVALAAQLADFSRPRTDVAAYQPDWRQQITRMRQRIEKERTAPGKDHLAIKTGRGGLIDAEFLAQTLCLAHGWAEPNTLRALLRAREQQALGDLDADAFLNAYRKLQRVEGILRRWSFVGEAELPDDPAPLYRVAVRCGFTSADEFLQAVGRYRAVLRAAYEHCFPPTPVNSTGRSARPVK